MAGRPERTHRPAGPNISRIGIQPEDAQRRVRQGAMVITEEIGALLANVHDTRVVGISLYPTGDLIVIQVKDIDATYADADESRGVRPGEIVLSGVTEARIAVDFREGLRTGAIE